MSLRQRTWNAKWSYWDHDVEQRHWGICLSHRLSPCPLVRVNLLFEFWVRLIPPHLSSPLSHILYKQRQSFNNGFISLRQDYCCYGQGPQESFALSMPVKGLAAIMQRDGEAVYARVLCAITQGLGGMGKGTFCQAPDLRLFKTSSCAWYAASFSCFFHSRSSLLPPPLHTVNNSSLAGCFRFMILYSDACH